MQVQRNQTEESIVPDSPPTFSNRCSWHKISLFQGLKQDCSKAWLADVMLGNPSLNEKDDRSLVHT